MAGFDHSTIPLEEDVLRVARDALRSGALPFNYFQHGTRGERAAAVWLLDRGFLVGGPNLEGEFGVQRSLAPDVLGCMALLVNSSTTQGTSAAAA